MLLLFCILTLVGSLYPSVSSLDNILAGLGLGICMILFSKLSRGALGLGDGIVFVGLGIYLGFWRCLEALWISLLAAALVSAVLLITKKVERRTKLPFLPFICLGYLGIMIW